VFGGGKMAGGVGCSGLPAFGRWLGRGGGTRSDEVSSKLPGVCLAMLPGTEGSDSGKFPSPYTSHMWFYHEFFLNKCTTTTTKNFTKIKILDNTSYSLNMQFDSFKYQK